jgi:hypothetical protein
VTAFILFLFAIALIILFPVLLTLVAYIVVISFVVWLLGHAPWLIFVAAFIWAVLHIADN